MKSRKIQIVIKKTLLKDTELQKPELEFLVGFNWFAQICRLCNTEFNLIVNDRVED
jgi:hypothetical protein